MITAQDIREKTFEKSKFGGYDMAEVDEFLEELADDLTNAQKESSVLKSKMKVLVDKIEEYRSNESALNQSILSAQKLAQQIESEARAKSEKMIADAEKLVQEKLGNITEQTAFEEKRLAAAKAASDKFLDAVRSMCNMQLKNVETLGAAALNTALQPDSDTAVPQRPAEKAAVEEPVRVSREAEREPAPAPRKVKDADSTQPFNL